jgi:hypothetical protein
MRGSIVIARGYGDRPYVRRVWDADGDFVYLTNDEGLALLSAGKATLDPIPFRWEDVFAYAPGVEATSPIKWDNLERWCPA